MATTFSSNIGSSSKGGFSAYAATTDSDNYVVAFFADMVTGEVTNAANGEEIYATTLSANQLAALSTNLKGLLAAAVASGADPTNDPLAYLRKLVGFVALNDGQALTYTATNISGDVYEFYIELTGVTPGTVLMYIPNSASAGLFTGSGSDEASGAGTVTSVTGTAPITVDNTDPTAPIIGFDGTVIPTTQRSEYVANVPGLPLAGVACLSVPNPAGTGEQTITLTSTLIAGFASTTATVAAADFRVEKFLMSGGDPGVGAATHMFDINFAVGASQSTVVVPVGGGFTVLPGYLFRVVNPDPANATLADVAITLVGQLPL